MVGRVENLTKLINADIHRADDAIIDLGHIAWHTLSKRQVAHLTAVAKGSIVTLGIDLTWGLDHAIVQ